MTCNIKNLRPPSEARGFLNSVLPSNSKVNIVLNFGIFGNDVNGFATDAPTGQSANNLRPPSEARGS